MGRTLQRSGFIVVCGLAVSLATSTAHDEAPVYTPEEDPPAPLTVPRYEFGCDDPAFITRDAAGKPWISVNTMTADAVPVSFDVTFKAKAGGTEIDRADEACHTLDRHVYGMAESIFAGYMVKTEYSALPQDGRNLTFSAARNVETMINTMLSAAGWFEVTGLGLRNVNMPGLSSAAALQMMTRGIEYDDSAVPARYKQNTIRVETFDSAAASFGVDMNYSAHEQAPYTYGPFAQAVQYNLLAAFEEAAQDAVSQRPESCVRDDLGYITDETYVALAQVARDAGLAYVFEITMTLDDISAPQSPAQEKEAQDDHVNDPAPLCISAAIGDDAPAP